MFVEYAVHDAIIYVQLEDESVHFMAMGMCV